MNTEYDFWKTRVQDYLQAAISKAWDKSDSVDDIVKAIMPVVDAYAQHYSDMEQMGDDL